MLANDVLALLLTVTVSSRRAVIGDRGDAGEGGGAFHDLYRGGITGAAHERMDDQLSRRRPC